MFWDRTVILDTKSCAGALTPRAKIRTKQQYLTFSATCVSQTCSFLVKDLFYRAGRKEDSHTLENSIMATVTCGSHPEITGKDPARPGKSLDSERTVKNKSAAQSSLSKELLFKEALPHLQGKAQMFASWSVPYFRVCTSPELHIEVIFKRKLLVLVCIGKTKLLQNNGLSIMILLTFRPKRHNVLISQAASGLTRCWLHVQFCCLRTENRVKETGCGLYTKMT